MKYINKSPNPRINRYTCIALNIELTHQHEHDLRRREKMIRTSRVGESSWLWDDALKRHTTCHECEMVCVGLPTHSDPACDSHFEFQDSFCNELAGVGAPPRRAGAPSFADTVAFSSYFSRVKRPRRRAILLIFDVAASSASPPYILLGRRPLRRLFLFHASRILSDLLLS